MERPVQQRAGPIRVIYTLPSKGFLERFEQQHLPEGTGEAAAKPLPRSYPAGQRGGIPSSAKASRWQIALPGIAWSGGSHLDERYREPRAALAAVARWSQALPAQRR